MRAFFAGALLLYATCTPVAKQEKQTCVFEVREVRGGGPLPEEWGRKVQAAVESIPGILNVQIEGRRVIVVYDPLRVFQHDIEDILDDEWVISWVTD